MHRHLVVGHLNTISLATRNNHMANPNNSIQLKEAISHMHLTQPNQTNMDRVIHHIRQLLVNSNHRTVNIQLIHQTNNINNNSHMVNLAKPLTQLIIHLPQITNHHVNNDQLIFQKKNS